MGEHLDDGEGLGAEAAGGGPKLAHHGPGRPPPPLVQPGELGRDRARRLGVHRVQLAAEKDGPSGQPARLLHTSHGRRTTEGRAARDALPAVKWAQPGRSHADHGAFPGLQPGLQAQADANYRPDLKQDQQPEQDRGTGQ